MPDGRDRGFRGECSDFAPEDSPHLATFMNKRMARALIEVGFIIFLFYSNLLMGEFEKSGIRQGHSFIWALNDIFTVTNFLIAVAAGLIGYALVEYLRNRL